eukprot:2811298-Rhodomonas_salina.1
MPTQSCRPAGIQGLGVRDAGTLSRGCGGTLTEMLSVDLLGVSVVRSAKRAGAESSSVTVHGAGFGSEGF